MTNKIFFIILFFSFCITSNAKIYNIIDYGAKNDGVTLTTAQVQEAINECHKEGGGIVHVPSGTYLVGTINLKSNVEFNFETGAILKATTDLTQYQRHNRELAGIFYTEKSENVSITGNGRIFGRGMEFMYEGKAKTIGDDQKVFTRQKENFRKVFSGLGDGPLYPKDRFHQMVIFSECTNVTLSDFECIDAPYWTILIVHCDRVKITGLSIDNNLLIPNGDGIDIISCSNVNMSNCIITCGDDAIVVAGYANHHGDPGFKDIMKPSKNVNVSNCVLQSRSSGIRIGGHDQNHMSNYNFDNIVIYDSNRGINISVSDTGSVQNMNFSNIHIETRLHTGDWWGQGEPINITAMMLIPEKPNIGIIKNLNFTNITCVGENSIVMIASDDTRIQNVTFNNFDFVLRKSALEEVAGGNFDLRLNANREKELYQSDVPVIYLENVENIYFNQGNIGWDKVEKHHYTYAIEANKVKNMNLNNMTAAPSPSNPKLPAVSLKNCERITNNILK
ncbi:hypothetical protein IR083_01835 [Dysgonomonas sp. GY75]|uniref:glycoside hydrolase family 28 protein n=1 Tax=Dysgonomonas sp. GY75 TaxID=2780419 RepID=UPI0018836F60|nr:glycosyl hydrolase family 28 protein [Dysgonomonas sp. GY75]MBF0647556.1 hypothetical protein [Dysgonomonas sp. GY75]